MWALESIEGGEVMQVKVHRYCELADITFYNGCASICEEMLDEDGRRVMALELACAIDELLKGFPNHPSFGIECTVEENTSPALQQ